MPRTVATSPITVHALQPAHTAAASALVAARVRALRELVPEVPAAWADPAAVGRVVARLSERGAGAIAMRGGRLVGFMGAMLLDGHGGRWAWSPDVGHALADGADPRVLEALYARLAEDWVRAGCAEHAVTLLANDTEGAATLARLGFGQQVVDLVRGTGPVDRRAARRGTTVRRAGPADAPAIRELELGLRRHLAAAPIFLGLGPERSIEIHRRLLADPAIGTFVADGGSGPVAFLRIGPAADDVAMIVRDAGTASITGAFTLADRRGAGVATALLGAAVAWAGAEGYARCAVDHESANRLAGRFWARHFAPIAVSMGRRLPPRVLP